MTTHAEDVPLGKGAAEDAKKKLTAREEYNQVVIEAASNGDKAPPPFEEWLVSHSNR